MNAYDLMDELACEGLVSICWEKKLPNGDIVMNVEDKESYYGEATIVFDKDGNCKEVK